MNLYPLCSQFSLGETFKFAAKRKEQEAKAVAETPEQKGYDGPILQPRPAAPMPEPALDANMQHVRLESFEHNVDNTKYSILPTNGNKENINAGAGGSTGEELGELGMLHSTPVALLGA